ncbi:MAG: SpoIID/LytB domain-containing protein [Planctomycetota bacterium]|nr:SpoIID/LytB domain-containing protein [Planctomycetota bacterium]
MMRPALTTLLRWFEVADGPAAATGLVAACAFALGASSCTMPSGTSGGATAARAPAPTRPTERSPALRPGGADAEATAWRAEGEPVLRVRLVQRAKDAVVGGVNGAPLVASAEGGVPRTVQGPVRVTRLSRGWLLSNLSGGPPEVIGDLSAEPGALRLRPATGKSALTLNNTEYPGELALLPRLPRTPTTPTAAAEAPASPATPASPAAQTAARIEFDVIEHVPMEAYLPGVVSRELFPNWSLNAFKAQAIAARTYAMHERLRSRRSGEDFDLESTQLDQVYGGSVDHAVADRAVNETRGMVLVFEGLPLRAYYSSTCGGRPSRAASVWPTGRGFEFNLAAPIQGAQGPETACNFSPRYRWTLIRSREDLTRRLAAFGREQGLSVRGLKQLARVDVDTATPDGRPLTYKIFDADGKWYPISAEQLRTACNWAGTSGRPAVNASTRVYSGDLVFTPRGEEFLIEGRGFGHGVGLCQFGAEGMSRAGSSAEQIVTHYYPGAVLEKAY